jgi:hypothetical protein
MNPTAVVFWAFLALVGYLIGDSHGALIGLAIGMGLSLLASVEL